MLNTIKKKNKFRFSIYILFLFFLIFFNKFSTTSANANAYKITDLEISEPYNNNFNKEKVIDLAFKKAFEQILLKTTVLKEHDLKKLINIKVIYGLIESFSIVDEKFIDNKYISNFEVEFNKKLLFNYLERKNIFPSIPVEKDLILVPILINSEKNQLLLFSENTFYVNWNKSNENYFLLNYILPNINNKLIISNKKFIWNENQSVENIIQDLKLEFEKQWKKLNTINLSIKFPITLSVNSKNFDLIQVLEKKLYDLDLVSNYYIDSFSNEKIFYKVIYNGTPDKFINEFINSNINLNTNNPIWSLE